MKGIMKRSKGGLAILLGLSMILPSMPGGISFAAGTATVYGAAYQSATNIADTTLPDSVDVSGVQTPVTWSLGKNTFLVPYETVQVTGSTEAGDTVTAQVEVIPSRENELVYFVDASRDTGKESKAYTSVQALTPTTLLNKAADQVYNTTDKWGRVGTNFSEKGTTGLDVTKKIQTGWYSSGKTTALTYQYYLEPGTYTLTAGFYEWWNGRSMKLALSGTGMTSVTSETATVSGIGSSTVKSVNFTVDTACTVTMAVQNATGGEAPVISWFAVAKGEVQIPNKPTEIVIDGADVAKAAANKNGLTYKGFGVLSGNSTSNLLMDYKEEYPEAYQEMLEVLFGGEHPLIDHVKMEMGNDGNNSTGADACTMRFEDEEADASRSPGFQLAADAKDINPDVKVSFLRWEMPTWVSSAWSSDKTGAGYEAVYKWYRETIFDAYEKYHYIVDYVDPDKNETTDPDEAFIKWYKNRVATETEFPAYMDEEAIEAYHNIKIIASDENTSLNIVPSMRADSVLYNAVDAVGFHYRAGDATSTADYRTMADVDDKEVWYSEGVANFSYSEYHENKTTAYGAQTIGGFQSPLGLADNFIKSFVYSRKTHYIFQPAIGSFYEGLQYDHKEILSAREPWAGYVHYDPFIYMMQHFTKFSKVGWENEDNTAGIWRVIANASGNNSSGSDHLKNEDGNPSYMTLAAPDKSNFSVVIVNNSNKTLNYQIKAKDMELAEGAPVEIWETKTDSYLQYQGEAEYADGYYNVTVAPYSMITATTLDTEQNPEYTERLPEEKEKSVLDTDSTGRTLDTTDNILYADDFNYSGYDADYLEKRGNEPRYILDVSGAFAVEDGKLKQLLSKSVGQWNNNTPNCVVGDFRWMNYKASVDVTVAGSGYGGLNIRQQTGMNFEGSGYSLQITKSGSWTLKKRSTTLASGTVTANQNGSYKLELEGKGKLITARIDGKDVTSYVDSNPEYFGRVRLGCNWETTSFDNLVVEKLSGYIPYATELIDNASDEVSYTGTWDTIAAGDGASSYDWYRTKSTTSTADSTFSFDMTGAGFALIGANDATAVLDITVDGETVAENAATNSSSQHYSTYMLTGLEDAAHSVTVTVKSGKMVLDAIHVLPLNATDSTALKALIEQAAEIQNEDYTEATWNTFQSALEAAQEVEADEAASQEAIDNAYYALKDAIDGLKKGDAIVSAEEVSIAAYAGGNLSLPSSLTCTTAAEEEVSKEVIWDTEDISALTVYDTLTVTGTIKDSGFEVSATVEVVPANLQYFINAGTGIGYVNNNAVAAVSKPYNAVSALVTNLKNNISDAAYTSESGWGFVNDSTYKVSATVSGGDRPDSYTSTDKYSVGLRDKTSGTQPMVYRFTLDAGTYELTTGYHEFYGSGRLRDMQPSVSWTDSTGASQTVNGEIIYLRSADTKGTISFTLDQETVVEYHLMKVANEAPMYSWIGIAKTAGDEGETVDKSSLETAINTAKELDKTKYTPESYADVEAALSAAETILADDMALQETVDAAAQALDNAIANLKEKTETQVDKDALQTAVSNAKTIDKSQYTAESYAEVEKALSDAEEVLADTNTTQEVVDAAVEALNDAIADLEEIVTVDKAVLEGAISSAKAIDGSKYTAESYAEVQKALSEAESIWADANATQEAIDAAVRALNNAVDALKAKAVADKTALKAVINSAKALDSSKYTAESYAEVKKALSAAESVLMDDEVSQEAVNNAVQALNNAMVALKEKEVEASSVALNYNKITMKKGSKFKWLSTAFTPDNTTNKTLTWASSNTKIATVDKNGVISAKKTGTATITAKTVNGKTASVKVTVQTGDVKVSKITLNEKKQTVTVGDKVTLKATVAPVNATNSKVTWASSNTKVAKVSSKGVVTTVGTGTAKITVKAKDASKKTATFTITVKKPGKPSITTVTSNEKKKAELTWGKVDKASGYEIYAATSKNGTYKKVATVSKGSTVTCTVKKLTSKKTYYFKVKAYITVSGKKVYSEDSSKKSVKIK